MWKQKALKTKKKCWVKLFPWKTKTKTISLSPSCPSTLIRCIWFGVVPLHSESELQQLLSMKAVCAPGQGPPPKRRSLHQNVNQRITFFFFKKKKSLWTCLVPSLTFILVRSYEQVTESSQTVTTCGPHFEKHCSRLQNSPSAWDVLDWHLQWTFDGVLCQLVSLSLPLVKHPSNEEQPHPFLACGFMWGSCMTRAGQVALWVSPVTVNGSGKSPPRASQSA